MRAVLFILALVTLGACAGAEHVTQVECSNIRCDTIDTYEVNQFCADSTYHYDLTYVDTIRLQRMDGELSFALHRCHGCKGTQFAWILDENNKPLKEVMILHKGVAVSEKIKLEELFEGPDKYVKVNWSDPGKIFYLGR
jgi:hypothetical protein